MNMNTLRVLAAALIVLSATALAAHSPTLEQHGPVGSQVTFSQPINTETVINFPYAIAAGDLNGDGIPDIFAVSTNNAEGGAAYAFGKGDGTFGSWHGYAPAAMMPTFVTMADVNLDGHLDVLTSSGVNFTVGVALGNSHGDFPEQHGVQAGNIPVSLLVTDVNGDGLPDIVGTNRKGVFVLLGKGNGGFDHVKQFYSGGMQPIGIDVGDVNGDGIPDVVVANIYGNVAGNVSLLLGKGDGTFGEPKIIAAYESPSDVKLGDFNGDGNLDLAVSDEGHIAIFLGDGHGNFILNQVFKGIKGLGNIVVADFNGDGILDLACGGTARSTVAVLQGHGDGTFAQPVNFTVGRRPYFLITSDFNQDGKPDLATVSNDYNVVSVLLNTTNYSTR
jgi:hypothetical protein